MSGLTPIRFDAFDPKELAQISGHLVVVLPPEGTMGQAARTANRLTKGALARLKDSETFTSAKTGQVISLNWPSGLVAEALHVLVLPKRISQAEARKAGAELAKLAKGKAMTVMAGPMSRAADLAMGIALRAYDFDQHKTSKEETQAGEVVIAHKRPEEMTAAFAPLQAVAEGVHMTRDLINEPANVLTTTEFARRIEGLSEIGLPTGQVAQILRNGIGDGLFATEGQQHVGANETVGDGAGGLFGGGEARESSGGDHQSGTGEQKCSAHELQLICLRTVARPLAQWPRTTGFFSF